MAGQRDAIPAILILGDVAPGSGATVGGKAAHLADLSRAGFPVPRGIVVTASAERIAVDQLLAALDMLAQRGATFAVRSSAVVEDGVETSFAGQYLSLLNVARLDVSAAVEQVRSSGASKRVAYGGAPEAIPVLIQPMVSAVAAGVAFTADPITGDRTTTIVTAVHGLGSRLVSGEVNGEEWVVREGRATPRGVGDGVLDAAKAAAIAALARRVATRYGNPQDIEWAFDGDRIHLLQARPMTGLSAIRSWGAPAPGYFSRNFRFGEWIAAADVDVKLADHHARDRQLFLILVDDTGLHHRPGTVGTMRGERRVVALIHARGTSPTRLGSIRTAGLPPWSLRMRLQRFRKWGRLPEAGSPRLVHLSFQMIDLLAQPIVLSLEAIMLALRLVALALGAFRPFSQVFDLTSGPIVQGWVA